jgi:hypothetical protein
MKSIGYIASTVLIMSAAACSDTTPAGSDGSTGTSQPEGYAACSAKYFSTEHDECTTDADCGGALVCRSDCPTCATRCYGTEPCDDAHPVSSCAQAYSNLCAESSGDPFYYSCTRFVSGESYQCFIMSGTAPPCTDASHIGPGC